MAMTGFPASVCVCGLWSVFFLHHSAHLGHRGHCHRRRPPQRLVLLLHRQEVLLQEEEKQEGQNLICAVSFTHTSIMSECKLVSHSIFTMKFNGII